MLSIINLLLEMAVLAARLHRPDMPLGRALPGDVVHDWCAELTRLRDRMRTAIRDAGGMA